ncbi:Na+/H+ antiporter NhaA [Sandaracinus amylolyticus]|uniref:Na(+)/H(+) antiporter NhaA n=1 Tax=Sandaracinus amylolyticus TaxID=927083 RepID=A0A0F6WA16_9BACT|nr:Na+/H+ antiporter NhaA [Sandaracinus amylolyticus]AKF11230.1 Na+/H+ antiporter NhaA type [Sandaracinus amylolyticus]
MSRSIHQRTPSSAPPEAWQPIRRAVRTVTRPVEAFLATEVASGAILLVATTAALVWANSPWAARYHALWATPIGVHLGGTTFAASLHFVVNEVLMTFFFFVVGLEIRREIARGELSEPRRAALPLAAALGGMLVPAAVYLALNAGRTTSSGWGVPMATDIAFAVGVLTLLRDRVSPGLRILLLALAVIDDVGAILVIGVFYSSGFDATGLALAALGVVGILLLQAAGARRALAYVIPGAAVWQGLHAAGVHATLAGVIVGLMTPTRAWYGSAELVAAAERAAASLGHDHLDALDHARRESVAPVDALQHACHRWVAFVVMPLFAFANAGVSIGATEIAADAVWMSWGIALGLVAGKTIGIAGGSWLAVRLGLATLPRGVTWRGVVTVALVGGIGFTMSLFVAELAFEGALLEAAKLAILVGSISAAVLGLVFGRVALTRIRDVDQAATESEAEASTTH